MALVPPAQSVGPRSPRTPERSRARRQPSPRQSARHLCDRTRAAVPVAPRGVGARASRSATASDRRGARRMRRRTAPAPSRASAPLPRADHRSQRARITPPILEGDHDDNGRPQKGARVGDSIRVRFYGLARSALPIRSLIRCLRAARGTSGRPRPSRRPEPSRAGDLARATRSRA